MRTETMQEAEQQERARRSEAWLAVSELLLDAEAIEGESTIVDSRRAAEAA